MLKVKIKISSLHSRTSEMEDNSKSSTFFKYLNIPHVEDPRFCPVCDSEAPDGEVHKPHFGAICCYSCRAFFRRSVHCKAYKDLTCKDGRFLHFSG